MSSVSVGGRRGLPPAEPAQLQGGAHGQQNQRGQKHDGKDQHVDPGEAVHIRMGKKNAPGEVGLAEKSKAPAGEKVRERKIGVWRNI